MTGLVVIGLMSGTSVDGIDAAVLKTDGRNFQTLGYRSVYDYRNETRDAIWTAVANPDAHVRDESMRVNLDRLIAEDHARAVRKLVDANGFTPTLIGFHGQTIYHNPDGQIEHPLGRDTIQLGNASLLAQITNLPVVYDVRSADMAAGGQGAPLAPVFHAAMLSRLNVGLPAVLVNVGGVANLTWFDGHDGLIGFDTGPGNALMDDYMRKYCDAAFDKNGELAASGIADWQLVHEWLRMPFFAANWPKSLDRLAFHHCLDDPRLLAKPVADAMASLALFTAKSIAAAIDQLPAAPQTILIAGGGARNLCLLSILRHQFGTVLHDGNFCEDEPLFRPDTLEAELMAFLAARHLAGLPTSFPSTTGCSHPVCGGKLVEPTR